jgi:hypothetical protein
MGNPLSVPPHAPHSASKWLAVVKAAERDGEFFPAYDAARQGLSEHPDDLQLRIVRCWRWRQQ